MRHTLVLALTAVALASAGCNANAAAGIHVFNARAEGTDCTFSSATLYNPHGSLDVAGGSNYYQVFGWENTLTSQTIGVGGVTYQDPTWHTFYAHQVQMTYTATNPAVAIPAQTEDIAASIAAGSTEISSSVGFDLVPDAVLTMLQSIVPAGTVTNGMNINVKFRLVGEIGGEEQPANTDWFQFPITVFNSGVAPGSCPATDVMLSNCGQFGKDQFDECVPAGP